MTETKTYRGYTIKVEQDETPTNPRTEWDNLGTMACFHNRYTLGDRGHGYDSSDYDGWDELEQAILKDNPEAVILPIYLYDHSGITINTTGFSCPWDSGQIGFIFVSLYEARKEMGWKVITKERREQLEKYLRGEVETYDHFLTGNVYGFEVTAPDGEEIHSCWGFYGDHEESGLMEDARGQIDWAIKDACKTHFEKLKAWIKNKVELTYRIPCGAL